MDGVASNELSIAEVYAEGPVLPQGDKLKIRTLERHPKDPDFYYTLGGVAGDLVLVTFQGWAKGDVSMIKSRLAEVSFIHA